MTALLSRYKGRAPVLTDLNGSPFGQFRNKVIGGDFGTNPSQRGTSFAAPANGAYTLDRWRHNNNTTGVVSISQSSASVPTVLQAGRLVTHCMLWDVTTADAAIAAGDLAYASHRIEGFNFQPIAQRPFVLSFWHAHTKTGIYCVSFLNSVGDRSYIAEYTQSVSDAWEYTSIFVSPSPSAGTWNYTSGIGLEVNFALAVGSTFHTTPNAWQTGTFIGTANQVNALDNTANNFRLALIQVEAGIVATPFEGRDFVTELALCQRYYEKSFQMGTAPAQNAGTNTGEILHQTFRVGALVNGWVTFYEVRKRVTATTITFFNPAAANAQARDETAGADCSGTAVLQSSEYSFSVQTTGNAATIAGNFLGVHWTAEAEL